MIRKHHQGLITTEAHLDSTSMNRNGQPGAETYPPWLWPNLLGLDGAAVAVAWQWLFARTFDANLPPVFHLILGLSVWCVYLTDRLYDATRCPNSGTATDRLRFTKRNFVALSAVTIVAALANLFLIMRHVPAHLMTSGLVTAGLVGIYYLIRLKGSARLASAVPREILCGMIFGIGSVIAPHAFLPPGGGSGFILPALLLGLVCSANCVLISLWEKEEDIAVNDLSMATQPSRILPHIGNAINALILLASAMAIFGSWRIHLALAVSALALRLMLDSEDYLSRRKRRVLADVALLSPLLLAFT